MSSVKKNFPPKNVIKLIARLAKYSERYEINIQMWPTQWAVYISKDDVDLASYGGEPLETLDGALKYLKRINTKTRKSRENNVLHRTLNFKTL